MERTQQWSDLCLELLRVLLNSVRKEQHLWTVKTVKSIQVGLPTSQLISKIAINNPRFGAGIVSNLIC